MARKKRSKKGIIQRILSFKKTILLVILLLGAFFNKEALLQFIPKEFHEILFPDTRTSPPNDETHGHDLGNYPDQLKIITWNLNNFGKSKNDKEIYFIAQTLSHYDIVALQEIVTSTYGAKAIIKLLEQLNRTGNKWDYKLSDPTTGDREKERYAYLWKTNKVKVSGRPWLVKPLEDDIAREPYMMRFIKKNDPNMSVLCANFHAIPEHKKPAKEIKLLRFLHQSYKKDNLVILGDFNLSQKKEAFDGLKSYGYQPVITDEKTSLKRKMGDGGTYVSNPFDNIFIEQSAFTKRASGVVDFVAQLQSLETARQISDHLPVWVRINRNN